MLPSLTINLKGLKQIQRAVGSMPKVMAMTARKALKDTMTHLRAQVISETTARYYITASKLRSAMSVTGSTLRVSGGLPNVASYKLTPKTPPKKPRTLRVAVKKTGLKPLKGAFLMKSGTGYIAMRRKGKRRLPIVSITGPAIPEIVGNAETLANVEASTEEYYGKRMEYWAMRAIGAVK